LVGLLRLLRRRGHLRHLRPGTDRTDDRVRTRARGQALHYMARPAWGGAAATRVPHPVRIHRHHRGHRHHRLAASRLAYGRLAAHRMPGWWLAAQLLAAQLLPTWLLPDSSVRRGGRQAKRWLALARPARQRATGRQSPDLGRPGAGECHGHRLQPVAAVPRNRLTEHALALVLLPGSTRAVRGKVSARPTAVAGQVVGCCRKHDRRGVDVLAWLRSRSLRSGR
jgi:hypothetical protein